jgi:hypothetical protein
MESFRTPLTTSSNEAGWTFIAEGRPERTRGGKGYGAFNTRQPEGCGQGGSYEAQGNCRCCGRGDDGDLSSGGVRGWGPNSPGQSGKFKPNSEPCQGPTTSRTVPARRSRAVAPEVSRVGTQRSRPSVVIGLPLACGRVSPFEADFSGTPQPPRAERVLQIEGRRRLSSRRKLARSATF